MKHRILVVLAFLCLAMPGIAQEAKLPITVDSKGDDIRLVIHNVFKQAGKSFVLKPGVKYELFLSLEKVEFEDALKLILDNADLTYTLEKGVYQISPRPKVAAPVEKPVANTPPKDDLPPLEGFKGYEEKAEPKSKGKLPITVLDKKVTTRLQKRDIREVFNVFSKQTGLTFDVAKEVPSFKLDVFYLGKTLKQALDEITKATRLKYRLTDQLSIAIEPLPLSGSIGGA